jgi:hypothetical protein
MVMLKDDGMRREGKGRVEWYSAGDIGDLRSEAQ